MACDRRSKLPGPVVIFDNDCKAERDRKEKKL